MVSRIQGRTDVTFPKHDMKLVHFLSSLCTKLVTPTKYEMPSSDLDVLGPVISCKELLLVETNPKLLNAKFAVNIESNFGPTVFNLPKKQVTLC